MATSTPNYGLKKFESGDPPDLPSLAASMDKIDTELKNNAANIGLSHFLFKFRGSLSGLNADTVTESGWWRSYSENPTAQGLPAGFTYSILFSFTTDIVYTAQFALNLGTSVLKRRQKTTSTFSAWADV